MNEHSDRHLLLGLLALQNGFISKEQLVASFSLWTLNKQQSLENILVEQKALTEPVRLLLVALVDQHLLQHGNDPERSYQSQLRISHFRRVAGVVAIL